MRYSQRLLKGLSLFLALMLSLSGLLLPVYAEEEEAAEVRGTPPPLNSATGNYELSTPDHLLYLSGTWKEDAPRDGNYVLTSDIDMAGVKDFLPIAALKKEGYLGTFDGQHHAIRNLTILYPEKYVGLFGYVGNEDQQAYIKNLALLDCDILGKQNVGGLVGVCYGTVTGCVVTGKIEVDRDASNAHTAGGIAGKVKEGEGPIIGHVENCYVDSAVLAPYDVGGIAGIQDGGGYIGKCFATGSVEATSKAHSGGGVVGSFNAGQYLVANVAAPKRIVGFNDMDLVVGQLADESGVNISGNLAWEGTLLEGNEPDDHPNQPTYAEVSGEDLAKKQTYLDLEWDFTKDWQWVGSDTQGHPLPAGFDPDLVTPPAYQMSGPQIIHYQLNRAKQNGEAVVTAQVVAEGAVDSVKVFYGSDENGEEFTKSVDMELSGDAYTASLPTQDAGDLYYYIQATAGGKTVNRPYHIKKGYRLHVDDGTVKGQPEQITVTPGAKQGSYRLNWLTVPEVTDTVARYRLKDSKDWVTVEGDGYRSYITEGWKEAYSHKVELADLPSDTHVVYQVGDGKDFVSAEAAFKTAKAQGEGFSFLVMSDPQSVTEKDYKSFKNSMAHAVTVSQPDFLLIPGDITQDGYKSSEWDACFAVMQEFFTYTPVIALPGNHEMKGDWDFVNFASRFNMPGGKSGTAFDNTIGSFEMGDACIVVINTEVTPPAEKPDILKKQMDWAKQVFEASDKTWRIMATHAGPYTSNHPTDEVKEHLIGAVDEMEVDLFINGHDHIYIRGTVKGDQKVAIGEGTTYLTAGTVGNKYYAYLDASDQYTDFYCDDEDQQIFSVITVTGDSITGKAYQRAPEDEETETIDWEAWEVIDEYAIPKPLHTSTGPAPAATKAEAPQAEEGASQAEAASSSGNTTVVVVVVVAVVAIGAGVFFSKRKKK